MVTNYFKEALDKTTSAGQLNKTKIILTKKNLPYDNNYNHIPYFETAEERDLWINNNLFEEGDDYKFLLENSPNRIPPITNSVTNSVINFGLDYEEGILEKNYAIVKQGDTISFHFITAIFDSGNQKTYNLALEKDIFMNNINFMNKIKNFKLSQGHIDSDNYFGYQIDGGNKEIYSIQDFPQEEINEVYNQLKNKGWLVVLEKVTNQGDYIPKISNGVSFAEPFKIYIAPLTPIKVKDFLAEEVVLYEQSSPTEYAVMAPNAMENKIQVTIGLSRPLDNQLDTNVYSEYIANDDSSDQHNKTFIIQSDWLPVFDGDERVIVLPYQGDEAVAIEANKAIALNGVYTEEIKLNTSYYGGRNDEQEKLYYMPMKIIKYSETTFLLETITINEMLQYLPNSYLRTEIPPAPMNNYYRDFDNKERYGLRTVYDQGELTFYKVTQSTLSVWNSVELFNYLEDNNNANIIGAKTTNFIAIDTAQTEGIFEIGKSNNLTQNDTEKEKGIFRLSSLNYDNLLKVNQYKFDVSGKDKLEFIDGLNRYSMLIENLKELPLNPNFITAGKLVFEHYASFTPNWEERFKYISSKYFSVTNENNSLINSKEFLKGTDDLAQYKVNNPVAWKDFARPFLDPLTDFLPFLGGESRKKSFGAGALSGARFGLQELGAGLSRISLKKQPEQFSGNGDINGDLIFNQNSIKLSLVTYQYTTPERDGIIETIKRKGMTYENCYISDYESIKRPYFNFIKLEAFKDSDIRAFNFSNEEEDFFMSVLERGVTIWNNPNDTYLDFTKDNQDGTF